mgnify:CR=1 FL=1
MAELLSEVATTEISWSHIIRPEVLGQFLL